MKPESIRHSVFRAHHWAAVIAGVTTWMLSGCSFLDNLLEVQAPSQVVAETLDDPANAPLLVNSIQGTFECAFGAYVIVGGEIADELSFLGTSTPRTYYDRRALGTGTGVFGFYGTAACDAPLDLGAFAPLNTTRWYADDVLNKLQGWTDAQVANRQRLIATAAAYSGYSHVLLGEGFCSGSIDIGPELTPAQIWARGETKFTQAIAAAQSSGTTNILNLSLVGRARIRRDLGRLADAATDARLVPSTFVALATASSAAPHRYNRIFYQNNNQVNSTVEPSFRGLTVGGVPDTRVQLVNITTPRNVWAQTKYTALSTGLPIASYDEAQLIISEAELEAGNLQLAVDAINLLRTKASLPSFNSIDAAEIRAQIIDERRRELFLESHRLYDMIRYQIPFIPAVGSPFPGFGGGFYENTTCMPLPQAERLNNPNITPP